MTYISQRWITKSIKKLPNLSLRYLSDLPKADELINGDVIKWTHFPPDCLFVRGILPWPVNFPYKGQWHEVLMFFLTCAWINGWVNNREAGDLRRDRPHYDISVMPLLLYASLRFSCIFIETSDNVKCGIIKAHCLVPASSPSKCLINRTLSRLDHYTRQQSAAVFPIITATERVY